MDGATTASAVLDHIRPGADLILPLANGEPVRFGTLREPTKVRINGMVDSAVARLEFTSAPGGPAREIPLVEMFPGQRAFSFRLANIAAGRLAAYGHNGEVLAVFTDSLNPPG